MIVEYKQALDSGAFGAVRIAAERRRQIVEKSYSLEYDQAHVNNELLRAALAYCHAALILAGGGTPREVRTSAKIAVLWPWDRGMFRPSEDASRNLEKAGALVAAEIDRLEWLSISPPAAAAPAGE